MCILYGYGYGFEVIIKIKLEDHVTFHFTMDLSLVNRTWKLSGESS